MSCGVGQDWSVGTISYVTRVLPALITKFHTVQISCPVEYGSASSDPGSLLKLEVRILQAIEQNELE